jgi:hypothetical protein
MYNLPAARANHFRQEKLAASSMLPLPLYEAVFG